MRNIIITGGELFNKGAQAMTFIAVDELKRRFPDHSIYVLSTMDLERPIRERNQYSFEFIGWYPLKFAKCQFNPLLKLECKLKNRREFAEAERIYQNTDLMIDISGYALGSNWGYDYCSQYLDHIEFAKAYGFPVYLMPQSFGPFDFQGAEGAAIRKRIAELLPYANKICAREEEGFLGLQREFKLTNVICAPDLVVNNRGIDLNHIYKKVPSIHLPEIQDDSVAVIPNQRNLATADPQTVINLYGSVISDLLLRHNGVYLLSHSDIDLDICRELKQRFSDNERVILLMQDFSCIEYNQLVQSFEFIVASRFHSIVHAFKNNVPAVAIGWANKYHDLMQQFQQEAYLVDVRQNNAAEQVHAAILKLESCLPLERDRIHSSLEPLQRENIFDILEL